MRILITFKPERNTFLLPTNYNYEVSSLIYHIMSLSGPKFTSWLHSRGFQLEGKKRFKFFNFSRLFFNEKEVQGDIIKAKGNFRMLFSSPIDESVLTNFISGMMDSRAMLYLGNKDVGTKIKILNVKILPYPNFDYSTKYLMLSPTVASVQDSNKKIIYLNPYDQNLKDTLIKNAANKYETIYMEKCPYEINIEFDKQYLEANWDKGNIMKLISIKVGSNSNAKIKGFMAPITIESDKIIHKLLYETGIGEKNSLGFGMLEIVKNNQENRTLSMFPEK